MSPRELAEREAYLNERELELMQREMILNERERQLALTVKNWPVCCKIVHHDIGQEIPVDAQHAVKMAYFSLYLLVIGVIYAAICCLIAAFVLTFDVLDQFFISLIIVFAGIPGAILLWYLRLYNGAKSDSYASFVFFFIFYLCHVAFAIICAVAPPFKEGKDTFFMTGIMAGMKIAELTEQGGNAWLATMYFVGAGLWMLEALLGLYVFVLTVQYFRKNDGAAKAKREWEAQMAASAMNQGRNQLTRAPPPQRAPPPRQQPSPSYRGGGGGGRR